mgnify:CR=1 FL=1
MARNPLALVADNTPPVILWLLIANGVAFLLKTYAQSFVLEHFALWPLGNYRIQTGHGVAQGLFEPWQLITYGFLHASILHLFLNMFVLWMFGRVIEKTWSQWRFIFFYAVCIIGGGLTQLVSLYFFSPGEIEPTIGASAGVFGVLLAFGVMFPNVWVMLALPPIPMKAKWFVLVIGALELFYGVTGTESGIAHFAHLGGIAFGGVILLYWWRTGRLLN